MSETKILKSDIAKEEFKKINDNFEQIIEKTSPSKIDEVYGTEFGKIFERAVEKDLACQDYLGYIFKRGKKNLVPENIELSMKWQFLSAANGNEYTIERLAIFLNSAYDEILNQDDVEYMAYALDFNEENYQFVLGKLVCEAICDELEINENNIITDVPDELLYNSSSMFKFDTIKNKATKTTIDYLRNKYLNMRQFAHLKKQYEQDKLDQAQKELEEKQAKEKPSFFAKIFKKKEKSTEEINQTNKKDDESQDNQNKDNK